MPKEDKVILSIVLIALGYFGTHVGWALMQPWLIGVASALPK
jgi:hypothetical protein